MAYEITGEEYKILLKNTDMTQMEVKRHGGSIADYQAIEIYSKATDELRVSAYHDFHKEAPVYTIHSEFLENERREPMAEMRITVGSWGELQAIIDLLKKTREEVNEIQHPLDFSEQRKEEGNGTQG